MGQPTKKEEWGKEATTTTPHIVRELDKREDRRTVAQLNAQLASSDNHIHYRSTGPSQNTELETPTTGEDNSVDPHTNRTIRAHPSGTAHWTLVPLQSTALWPLYRIQKFHKKRQTRTGNNKKKHEHIRKKKKHETVYIARITSSTVQLRSVHQETTAKGTLGAQASCSIDYAETP